MSEWVSISFSDAGVDFIDGDRGKNYPSQSDFSCKGDCLFLSTKNVRPNGFDFAETQFITYEKDKILRKGKLERGDIVLTTRGTVGNIAFYDEFVKYQNIRINSGMVIIRPNIKLIEAKFLLYFFRNFDFTTIISGSAQPQLPIRDLKQIDIKLPPLPEQQAIASVLSALDDKIDLLQRQNQTLEQMAATLFRQWFIEEAKEGWEKGYLKDEFHFVMGQSPKGDSFNDTGIGIAMFQGNADFGFRFPKERIYTTEPTRFAEPLDTLISVRAPVGAQNMAKVKCCIGRGVAAFRHIKNTDWYTYTYFKLNYLMVEIKKFNDEGTVFGSISKSDFEKIEVVIPDENTILEFEKMAKPLNEKINLNCHAISNLTSLRDTLLPKLISGEVRLKGFEPVS